MEKCKNDGREERLVVFLLSTCHFLLRKKILVMEGGTPMYAMKVFVLHNTMIE